MKSRENQLKMRTFLVRALSFSAATAMTLNPALIPAVSEFLRAFCMVCVF
jgi:pilus assembly protein CpaC